MMRLRQHVTFKSIFGIVLLLVLFSVIVSAIGYNSFTEALLQQYAEGAFLTAQTAAELVDADRMDEYAQSGGTTAAYLEVWDRMDHLCNTSGQHHDASVKTFDEILPLCDLSVSYRTDRRPKAVTLMPGGEALPFTYENGVLRTKVARVDVHAAIEIED